MSSADGMFYLADTGRIGMLNIFMNIQDGACYKYVRLACQWTFAEHDIPNLVKEEILCGCIFAALSGTDYIEAYNSPAHPVKHVPFDIVSADGYLSSTWFTCIYMKPNPANNVAHRVLKNVQCITPCVRSIHIHFLCSDLNDLLESILLDESRHHDEYVTICQKCGLPSWNSNHYECAHTLNFNL